MRCLPTRWECQGINTPTWDNCDGADNPFHAPGRPTDNFMPVRAQLASRGSDRFPICSPQVLRRTVGA